MTEFPKTQWSLIELVTNESPAGSREQMGRLLNLYREPMFVHLKFKGVSPEHAEDLIQDFMIEILNNDLLAIADPKKGKFRTLLLTALDRFVISRHRYDTAAKRSPGDISSLDAMETDQVNASAHSPGSAFDRAWALDVLAKALARMEEQCNEEGQADRWVVFESRIVGPLLDDATPPDYADLAEAAGLANEKAAMNLLITGKRQFARILREQIRDYITRSADTSTQIERIAGHMDIADQNEAMRTARQLTEQTINTAVEEEIDNLKQVLANTRSVADVVVREPQADDADLSTTRFWRRLSAAQEAEAGVDSIFTVGAPEGDQHQSADDEAAHFAVFLQTRLDQLRICDSDSSIGEALASESTPVELLNSIKDWSNIQRASQNKAAPQDIASAIFYGAIARAMENSGQCITSLNPDTLEAGFTWLAGQEWAGQQLQATASRAAKRVQQ